MSSLALCMIRIILPVRLFRRLAMHVLKFFGNPPKVMLVANNIIPEIIPLWHTSSGSKWLFARRLDGRWTLVREKFVVPDCCPPDLRQQVRCWPYNCFNLARAGGSHKVPLGLQGMMWIQRFNKFRCGLGGWPPRYKWVTYHDQCLIENIKW